LTTAKFKPLIFTDKALNLVSLIISRHGSRRKHNFCYRTIVAFVSVAVGTRLPSPWLETALVYLLISQSLHSNGCIQGTYIRTLCQKNKWSVEIKHKPIEMDSRTIYRTLSSKRTHFQIGIDLWSHLWKVPRGRRNGHTCPMWLWGYSSFKISSPGSVFHGTKWLLWRSRKWSPALHSKCGINEGLSKGEAL
jgi:hypothetical protein